MLTDDVQMGGSFVRIVLGEPRSNGQATNHLIVIDGFESVLERVRNGNLGRVAQGSRLGLAIDRVNLTVTCHQQTTIKQQQQKLSFLDRNGWHGFIARVVAGLCEGFSQRELEL